MAKSSLAVRVAMDYARDPAVQAVALGGSRSTGYGDDDADYDLYVYSQTPLSIEFRREVAERNGDALELNNQFWEAGDEWINDEGVHFDVMFRSTAWIEDQLARSLERHEASVGYSTCFWANVLHSELLFDRAGWYEHLQRIAKAPYPEALRRAIVAKNQPILRTTMSSYSNQIALAMERDDVISVHHRVAALLASYFDILFALNRMPHPGEKRQLQWVEERCRMRPPELKLRILGVLEGAYSEMFGPLDELLDDLDDLLEAEGLLAAEDRE